MFCSMCGAKATKTSLYCSKCGTKLEAVPEATPSASGTFFEANDAGNAAADTSQDQKRKRNTITVIVAVVSVLLLVGFGISAGNSGSDDTSSRDSSLTDETLTDDSTQDLLPVDWAPAGYSQWDDYLAYKWVTEDHTSDCSDCSYWFIEVVSHYGCPGGVYAEINMLDGDSVVDWSNDTVPSLGSSNSALLEFVHYPYESQLQGQLTDLTCNS